MQTTTAHPVTERQSATHTTSGQYKSHMLYRIIAAARCTSEQPAVEDADAGIRQIGGIRYAVRVDSHQRMGQGYI
jgi:hypothetical protein